MENLLDLYTDYLQVTFRMATATGMSEMMDGSVSHDKVTRLLSRNDFTSKDLWSSVKPLVRQHETEGACLIFDDSIVEKPYTDENELICWHFDHTKNRSVKGINLLTAFYHSRAPDQDLPLRVPIGFEAIRKPVWYCEVKTRKEKRESVVTKNELMRQMINRCIQNQVKFTYVLSDSWFGSSENMRLVREKKKIFIFDMKSNRLAVLSEEGRNAGRWTALEDLAIPAHTPIKVWLKDLEFPVALVKQVFTNKDNSTGVRYLVSNDLTMTYDQFDTLFKKRWSVEEYHKSIKQNTALAKSPTRTIRTQSNHLFASILAYVKLEKYKFTTSLNHFALKTKLYNSAIKAALKELHEIKSTTQAFGSA